MVRKQQLAGYLHLQMRSQGIEPNFSALDNHQRKTYNLLDMGRSANAEVYPNKF